jgi:hypothetical protein
MSDETVEPRTADFGTLTIGCYGLGAGGGVAVATTLGDLFVEYQVTLRQPEISDTGTPSSSDDDYGEICPWTEGPFYETEGHSILRADPDDTAIFEYHVPESFATRGVGLVWDALKGTFHFARSAGLIGSRFDGIVRFVDNCWKLGDNPIPEVHPPFQWIIQNRTTGDYLRYYDAVAHWVKNAYDLVSTVSKLEVCGKIHLEDEEEASLFYTGPTVTAAEFYSWTLSGFASLISMVGSFYVGPPSYTMSCRHAPKPENHQPNALSGLVFKDLPPNNGITTTHLPPGFEFKASAKLLKVDSRRREIQGAARNLFALPRPPRSKECRELPTRKGKEAVCEDRLRDTPSGRR